MDETPDEYAWMFHARCRGVSPAEFFPSDGTGVEIGAARVRGLPGARRSASSTRCSTASSTACGAARPNANGAASCAAAAISTEHHAAA